MGLGSRTLTPGGLSPSLSELCKDSLTLTGLKVIFYDFLSNPSSTPRNHVTESLTRNFSVPQCPNLTA